MTRTTSLLLVFIGLVAATMVEAQQTQTTIVPDVIVGPTPVEIFNEVTVMSDSTMLARIADILQGMRDDAAAKECDTCGSTSNVVRVGQAGLVLMAFWIAVSANKIANRESKPDVHEHEITVTTPPRDKKPPKDSHDDDTEGGNGR